MKISINELKKIISEVSDEDYKKINKNMRITIHSKDTIQIKNYPEQFVDSKPNGLWYAPGTEWIDFCRREHKDGETDYVFELKINESKILSLKTENDVRNFNERFGVEKYDMPFIDWKKVSEEYSGIEIIPYQWGLRRNRDYSWYYGWDIDSGCIWDASAIISANKL